MHQKTQIEQARATFVKTLRTAIRLKHSIEADREINEILPGKVKAFEKLVRQGQLPSPIDIKKLVNGDD